MPGMALLFSLIFFISNFAWSADSDKSTPESSLPVSAEATAPRSEIVLRLGNESNPVDGAFGPFTYGLIGSHTFENDFILQGDFIRLHEPGTATFESVLDEAQLTLKSPESQFFNETFVFDATLWKNRLIDMYTNVVGFEVTRTGKYSLTLGLYTGTATKDDLSEPFTGGQLSLSTSLEPFEVTASYMGGLIKNGSYRKVALEASTDLAKKSRLPFTLTFGLEERYYNFGNGGPESEPQDEYIFVTGVEVHFERALGL